jgi:hypothetical protein
MSGEKHLRASQHQSPIPALCFKSARHRIGCPPWCPTYTSQTEQLSARTTVSKDEVSCGICRPEVLATPSYIVEHHARGVPQHDAKRSPHLTTSKSAFQVVNAAEKELPHTCHIITSAPRTLAGAHSAEYMGTVALFGPIPKPSTRRATKSCCQLPTKACPRQDANEIRQVMKIAPRRPNRWFKG